MPDSMTEQQWEQFSRDGYLRLGKLLDGGDLAALQKRIDQIMLGTADVDYDRMLMQIDSDSGRYEDAGEQSKGFKGPTLNYRKIQDLERDPLFLAYLQRPLFRDICARVHGPGVPIATFRAMFMNKPARKGTWLPWHQDRWTRLDRDPLVTVWMALDPATVANGCVQVISGSHLHGLINPSHSSGFLTEEQAKEHAPKDRVVFLELAPGEAVLLHNYLLHASDVNRTEIPRRAFSVCYMDARTIDATGERYTLVFGQMAPAQPRAR